MGKKRSQNEEAMRETIQKLVKQRDAARDEFQKLTEGVVPKAEHELVKSALANAEARERRLEELVTTAATMHAAKYDALKAQTALTIASAHADLTAQVATQSALIDKLNEERSDYIEALDVAAKDLTEIRRGFEALELEVKALKGEDVKSLRKRLNRKSEFVKEQERYIQTLTSTIRHFMRHPVIVEYVAEIQKRERAELAALGAPVDNLSPTAAAIVNAEGVLDAKPVETEAT